MLWRLFLLLFVVVRMPRTSARGRSADRDDAFDTMPRPAGRPFGTSRR